MDVSRLNSIRLTKLRRFVPQVFALLLAGTPALAQSVQPCGDETLAANIAEPWEDNTALFANGEVRITLIDTVEPAVGAFWIMILTPPRDELGFRRCFAVGQGGAGFAGVDFDLIAASYDPAIGLVFDMPVRAFDPGLGDIVDRGLRVTVNQRVGSVAARYQ